MLHAYWYIKYLLFCMYITNSYNGIAMICLAEEQSPSSKIFLVGEGNCLSDNVLE
ncbi:Hypothetical protein ETEE_0283 [Edwardsiella anguillarum ET080813]|uniref:Uncharacterized protein n=1 Tax=Edwardsiella anguillarum ET080813 TaxID=667120 RepID=A0A076LJK3_9GAMM|nr:Hypothetical protein ETEE_0283 [Edwardsiella anguillarum ET080813]